MPGFDGTGPGGQGPRTGGGFGWCPPGAAPGGAVYGVGRGGRPWGGGRGRCFGGGRGWAGYGPPAYGPPAAPPPPAYGAPAPPPAYGAPAPPAAYGPPTPEDEVALLEQQAQILHGQLEAIQARLEELKQQK